VKQLSSKFLSELSPRNGQGRKTFKKLSSSASYCGSSVFTLQKRAPKSWLNKRRVDGCVYVRNGSLMREGSYNANGGVHGASSVHGSVYRGSVYSRDNSNGMFTAGNTANRNSSSGGEVNSNNHKQVPGASIYNSVHGGTNAHKTGILSLLINDMGLKFMFRCQ
jgi:hypothetical protein